MILEFKAKNIRQMEKETNKSFFELLENLSTVSNLTDILMAGGMTEDDAVDFLDEQGIEKAIIKIMEALTECGFLPQTARTEMKKSLKAMRDNFFTNSGEITNQKPSK